MRHVVGLTFLALAAQSPGIAGGQILLSEVMADPAGSEHHDEFAEVLNTSHTDTLDLSGWRLGDSDELDRIVSWGGSTDVSKLAGQPIRLRITLSDSDLYAIKFS